MNPRSSRQNRKRTLVLYRSRSIALALLALSLCCSAAHANEASVILVNGKVWTENPALPIAHAVALDGNTILAVGDDATIRKLAGPDTKVIDLHGRLLLPGFNDAHVHFLDGGASLISVELGTRKQSRRIQGAHRRSSPRRARQAHGFATATGIISAGILPTCRHTN